MRKWVSVAIAAGLFFGGAGGAVADSVRTIAPLHAVGVQFGKGSYQFEPKSRNHGGFHFRGVLSDLMPNDGHNVYVEVKVEAYDWNRFKGTQKKSVTIDRVVWDGAAQYTSEARIRACRDRGSLRPDNCSPTRHYRRMANGDS
ncbi:hypothetical protein AB0A60_08765 [Streptomyces sp. NPDC046275]|uniref:hypothetical protein n=1 Tax=Streptomyces sp. NPDC046275 TaxID=3157201 RepID=UPI0033FD7D91